MTDEEFFTTYIVKQLVGYPESVTVERTLDNRGVLLNIRCDPSDMGLLIGAKGSTINAIRTVLREWGMRHNAHVSLKVIDVQETE